MERWWNDIDRKRPKNLLVSTSVSVPLCRPQTLGEMSWYRIRLRLSTWSWNRDLKLLGNKQKQLRFFLWIKYAPLFCLKSPTGKRISKVTHSYKPRDVT